ncbi:MDR family MFS transporter [Actinotalea ferrariae]|uniref:MDR family MFS transporter n=1 Tax=Actinotalea ferrariae TaxID=1386098 RepID=UPI0027DF87BC|nr:MDR family MFS transporter [Actinotalea ferrariae]
MSPDASRATPQQAVPFTPLGHRQILVILGGLMMGMFLAALDQTIVATAIRTIGDDLNGLSLQAWVTTAYLITSTIATPLYGKLSDIYGRKPLYLVAIAIFLVGSLLCGTATSMYQLAAYRAVQGLGGGGLMSLAITILGDLLSPRERAKYQAYFLAVFGTSSVLGPIIGGFFAGADDVLGITGWRWIFLVNVPFGILGMVVITRVLHLPPLAKVFHRIDWPGGLALAGGLVPLLLVAEQGREWGWGSPVALTCYALGVVGIAAFLLAERRAGDDALLPLHLFRNRTFGVSALINLVIGMGMFGGLATLPLYLQIAKGMTPTAAGLALLPLTLGIMTTSVVAGQTVARTGRYRIFPILGTICLTAGALLMSRLVPDSSMVEVAWRSAIFGFGLGFCFQPLVLAVQNAVPPKDMGVATSSSLFFRQMGGTLGTAVFLSILFSTVGGNIRDAFAEASRTTAFRAALADPAVLEDPANAPVVGVVQGTGALPSLDDSSFISAMDPRLAAPFLDGFARSTSLVLLIAAAVIAVSVVLAFLLPEIPLRQVSGIQSRLDAADATAPDAAGTTAAAVAGAEQGVGADAVRADAVDGAHGPESQVPRNPALLRDPSGPTIG